MDGKKRTIIGLLAAIMVIAGVGAWLYYGKPESISEAMLPAVTLILVAGALAFLLNNWRNVKSGLPVHDELSRKQAHKAGYYAYLSSIYLSLGLMYLSYKENPPLTASQSLGVVILLSGIVFMASALLLAKRGDVN